MIPQFFSGSSAKTKEVFYTGTIKKLAFENPPKANGSVGQILFRNVALWNGEKDVGKACKGQAAVFEFPATQSFYMTVHNPQVRLELLTAFFM